MSNRFKVMLPAFPCGQNTGNLVVVHGVVAVGIAHVGLAPVIAGAVNQGEGRNAHDEDGSITHCYAIKGGVPLRGQRVSQGRGNGFFKFIYVIDSNNGEVLRFIDTADKGSPVRHIGEGTEGFSDAGGVAFRCLFNFEAGFFGTVGSEPVQGLIEMF